MLLHFSIISPDLDKQMGFREFSKKVEIKIALTSPNCSHFVKLTSNETIPFIYQQLQRIKQHQHMKLTNCKTVI